MFKVGDKVYLREDSEWNIGDDSNPLNVIGTVVKLTPDYVLNYYVRWDNGIRNQYDAKDLVLVSDLKIDPLVTILQSEYDDLIEQINMLQELVSELYKEKESEAFRPISEYTIDDWKQAKDEIWVFRQRNGDLTTILTVVDDDNTDWPVEINHRWFMLDGYEYSDDLSKYDIVERIK